MNLPENSFAAACYEQNSVCELIDALTGPSADPLDCKEWRITPTQWRAAIEMALLARIEDSE